MQIPFSDVRAELRGVAAWAARLHRESPATTVGIVIAGAERVAIEYLLRREFNCLGADYNSLPVNFSTGISLAEAPAIRDALAVLSLGLDEVSVSQVISLLRSRFLDLPDADKIVVADPGVPVVGEGESVDDIREDLGSGQPLDRLLATDVGVEAGALPEEWQGPGLAIALAIGNSGALLLLPAAGGPY